MAASFFDRVKTILDINKIEYEKKVVALIIQKYFPDFRRTLNELQKYSSKGKIATGILGSGADLAVSDLVTYLKKREFTNMKKWVVQNLDNEPQIIMRKVYDTMYTYMKPKSIPEAVLIMGEYQYKANFVMDQEINLVAFMTELMMRCEFQ